MQMIGASFVCLLVCTRVVAELAESYVRTDGTVGMSVNSKGALTTEDIFFNKAKKVSNVEKNAKAATATLPLPGLDVALAKRIKATFIRMDMNEDRLLDHTDFMQIAAPLKDILEVNKYRNFEALNVNPEKAQEKAFRSFVTDMDSDCDGKVDFKNYASFMIEMSTIDGYAQKLQEKRDAAQVGSMMEAIPALRDLVNQEKAAQAAMLQAKVKAQ